MGEGEEAPFVQSLASSGARWDRITHKLGWFKKFYVLQSTPAEMVLVRDFLRAAHRNLGATKLVVGIPSSDVIIAADYEQLARLMVIATLRFTEVDASKQLSPDLFVVEDGAIVGTLVNTFLEEEVPESPEVKRVLRIGPVGEFHIVAGRDEEALLELGRKFVGFAAEKWLSDPKFGGDCVMFVTAPETMQPTLDELASELAAATETWGCSDRLRFRVERA